MMPTLTNDGNEVRNALATRVLNVTEENFDELSLDIFRYQFTYNRIYHEYCRLLGKDLHNVRASADIPFLPIALFKSHDIHTNDWKPEVVFESSATTSQIPSRHAIRDLGFYRQNCRRGFAAVKGRPVTEYVWLALLPSYIERPNSSLIMMVSDFISAGKPGSCFVTMQNVTETLDRTDQGYAPVAFVSVSFALLDLAESSSMSLKNTTIIETGGMKGRRAEPTRRELHERICISFDVSDVHSEYGMTELFSQAWSTGEGIFKSAPSLKILLRDLSDPLSLAEVNSRGAINCIDLANLDTCAFIATEDVGLLYPDGTFEILGRFDASELRGCNLLVNDEMMK
jgi:hypothetical protein